MKRRGSVPAVLAVLAGLTGPYGAAGFSGGPQIHVTDLVPACATCHSSVGTEQLRSQPADFAAKQTVEGKHYAAIAAGTGAYGQLSEADRAKLIEELKILDGAAKVSVSAPASVGRGQTITVTVRATGGAGPVVGLALLDGTDRFQARSITADGWQVVGTPKVIGPDGKEQTTWVDKRMEGTKKNLAFVLVYGVQGSAEKRIFPESQVTWTLQAPSTPGRYTIGVAFLRGTEKATTLGAVPEVGGGTRPRGGGSGPSGRIHIVGHTVTVN
ncbi:MAG TPA: hypothetical protein VNM66_07525 [Thermodesulfobacteriota bacterium]|nr:hypothetical protein [Thermodesulfobacteriota bacterium]